MLFLYLYKERLFLNGRIIKNLIAYLDLDSVMITNNVDTSALEILRFLQEGLYNV